MKNFILLLVSGILLASCGKNLLVSQRYTPSADFTNKTTTYYLPKKILLITSTYEIFEVLNADSTFNKTISCTLKDIKIQEEMVPDLDNAFQLATKTKGKISLKLDYAGTGVLNGINAESNPIGADLLIGTINIASTVLAKFVPLVAGVPSIAKSKPKSDTIAATVPKLLFKTRTIKVNTFIDPSFDSSYPLKTPLFEDDFSMPEYSVLIEPFKSSVQSKQTTISNVKEDISYKGVFYREAIPARLSVNCPINNKVKKANTVSILSQIVYFPQLGNLQLAPVDLDYGVFSKKKTVALSFSATTGGLSKLEVVSEKEYKENLKSINDALGTIKNSYDTYAKEKNKDTEYETKMAELQKQLDELLLEKKIREAQAPK
ncbi:MAG: hypothetical protein CFE21_08140 [Bacteroidetes bacterium B1(2017)]|nr:MAG: hypothetical protein CFE21_08140 [Bacteroidetes bacterium B1(2017)]